ncbi:MAG: amylo-alpha-1,6-glucosidase [Candidatus Aenigmatarchaeota archaeon]
MSFLLASNLSKNSYILAGKKVFFYRYCDTGFKTKWTGLWQDSKKFLDYFSFKINGAWLSPENCKSFEFGEIDATHFFNLKEIEVKEFLQVPENLNSFISLLTIQNNSEKEEKVRVEVELGINIREREENWHDRSYLTRFQDNKLIVESDKGCLVFGSSPAGIFEQKPIYKDHYPSGEKQRCFIPGNYFLDFALAPKSSKEIFFIFSLGESELEALTEFEKTKTSLFSLLFEKEKKYQELLNMTRFSSGIEELDELFKWSVINLEKLAFNSKFGFGYFAGYPWFTQFWGRDLGWIIPAIVDLGKFEEAREALKTLASFQSDEGKIPNVIYMNGKVDYSSADSTPLWIIALSHYLKNSGDITFIKSLKKNFLKALEWIRSKENKDGFIEHEEKETWMDTLERKNALEIQAMLVASLKAASEIAKIFWDDNELWQKAVKLERKFEKVFWNEKEGFYVDFINGRKARTINSIFPLFFEISTKPKKVLKIVESEEFTSEYGVRTISKQDSEYNPAGYHTGSSWAWIIGLVACAEFKNKNYKKALDYLKILYRNLNQDCVKSLGEAWNSENNDINLWKVKFSEPGACLQGWSSALVVRCVDEFLLGMKVDAKERTILFSPSLWPGAKISRRKRIGNDFVDFTIKRVKNKVEVSYKSENNLKYKVLLHAK